MSTSKKVIRSKSTDNKSVTRAAAKAVAVLNELLGTLPVDPGLVEKQRKGAIALQRVTAEGLLESAAILEVEGDRFPGFDPQLAIDAVEYERAMRPLVTAAKTLSSRVQASILQRRTPAVEQIFTLYAVLKGHARSDASVDSAIQRLSPHVNVRKHPHRTKKQAEKAQAKKDAGAGSPSPSQTPNEAAPPTPAAPAPDPGAPAPTAGLHS